MASPSKKLAESLQVLHELKERGGGAIRSGTYVAALEEASVGQNIGPFTDFLAQLVNAGLEGKAAPKLPS